MPCSSRRDDDTLQDVRMWLSNAVLSLSLKTPLDLNALQTEWWSRWVAKSQKLSTHQEIHRIRHSALATKHNCSSSILTSVYLWWNLSRICFRRTTEWVFLRWFRRDLKSQATGWTQVLQGHHRSRCVNPMRPTHSFRLLESCKRSCTLTRWITPVTCLICPTTKACLFHGCLLGIRDRICHTSVTLAQVKASLCFSTWLRTSAC